jgi:hypothetical protein
MIRQREFDVSELGMTHFLRTMDVADPPFIAIPVFPNRCFRLSFPKIISARNYGATQIGLVWWRWFRIAARPVVAAHPCPIPGVCEFRCNRTSIM